MITLLLLASFFVSIELRMGIVLSLIYDYIYDYMRIFFIIGYTKCGLCMGA